MPGEKSRSKKLIMGVDFVVFIEGLGIVICLLFFFNFLLFFFNAALFCSDEGTVCPEYSTSIEWVVSLVIYSNLYIEICKYIVMYKTTYFLKDYCKLVYHHLTTKSYELIQCFRIKLNDSMC